jgi:hypothetical protein
MTMVSPSPATTRGGAKRTAMIKGFVYTAPYEELTVKGKA